MTNRLGIDEAQSEFLKLLDRVQPKDIAEFLVWVQESFAVDNKQLTEAAATSPTDEAVVALREIANNIRCQVIFQYFSFVIKYL